MGLSREQMEDVIRNGGSVLIGKKLVASLSGLPTPAEMAKTPEEKQAAADDLDAQIAALQKKKEGLGLDSEEKSGKSSNPGEGELVASSDPARNREAQIKALARKNLDDLNKIVESMREEGYTVEFAEDAKKEQIIEAIVDAKKSEVTK